MTRRIFEKASFRLKRDLDVVLEVVAPLQEKRSSPKTVRCFVFKREAELARDQSQKSSRVMLPFSSYGSLAAASASAEPGLQGIGGPVFPAQQAAVCVSSLLVSPKVKSRKRSLSSPANKEHMLVAPTARKELEPSGTCPESPTPYHLSGPIGQIRSV